MLGGVGMLGDNIDKKRKMEKKATKKAKRLMGGAQAIASLAYIQNVDKIDLLE